MKIITLLSVLLITVILTTFKVEARDKFQGSRTSRSSGEFTGERETKTNISPNLSEANRNKIKSDFQSILQKAQKPSQDSVKNLTNDITTAMDDGKLNPKEAIEIQQEISEVLDSANIDANDVETLKEDVEMILEAADLDPEEMKNIISNVEDVVKSVK